MKKNLLNRLFLALVALLCCPAFSYGYSFKVDGIAYNLNEDQASVSVTRLADGEWYEGDVVIPQKVAYSGKYYIVTEIEDNAFDRTAVKNEKDKYQLSSIYIPETVKRIGESAFTYQNKLKTVTIPGSVTEIGRLAFSYCQELVTSKFPSSLTSLGVGAFLRCSLLAKADLSQTALKTLNDSVFYSCTNLTKVKLPNDLETIGSLVFRECNNIKSLELPEKLRFIGQNSFAHCGVSSIKIPETFTEIPDYAFTNSSIRYVDIPNTVTRIGYAAFSGAGLTALNLPPSVKEIGEYAFHNNRFHSLIIPNTVKIIGSNAFLECTGLKTITLGDSISSIGSHVFRLSEPSDYYFDAEGTAITITNDYLAEANFMKKSQRDYAAIIFTSNVTKINSSKLTYPYVRHIVCYSEEPPVVTPASTETSSLSPTLHVPAKSLAKYFTADYWNRFTSIVGDAVEPTAINLSEHNLTLEIGDVIDIDATISPEEAELDLGEREWYSTSEYFKKIGIGWLSTNSNVADFNTQTNKIYAKGKGECDIIAFFGNVVDTCHVVVNGEELPDEEVTTVVLDFYEKSLFPNEILTLNPKLNDKSLPNPSFTVECDNQNSLLVRSITSGNSLIVQGLALKPGVANITVSCNNYEDVEPAVCKVFVTRELDDINTDGIVNAADVSVIYEVILDSNADETMRSISDLNGDGYVNAGDISILYQNIINAEK